MKIQRAGGIAAIVCTSTYLFGFVFFFGLIDAPADSSDMARLRALISQRDIFFIGYAVIGIVFSLSLLLLNQSLLAVFEKASPIIARYNSAIGYIWAAFVLASTFVFLVSLPLINNYANTSEEHAVIVLKNIDIVVDALGGGIELLGAIWVMLISFIGIKNSIYPKGTHLIGIVVGVAGILTLFSGLSFLSAHSLFEASTAIFGLGQIVWFILIAVHMLRHDDRAA